MRARWILAGIFAVALVLRVANNHPAFFSFWFDEAEYSLRASYILANGGAYPADKLFDHPPALPYLLALAFALIGPAWWAARAVSVVLGLATVWLAWRAGREWRDERVGLVAAALVAVTPLSVYVTREVVLEPLLGFGLALALLGLVRVERGGARAPHLALVAGGLALAALTKVTAVFFAPAFLWYVYRARLAAKPAVWVAAAAAVAPVVPIYLLMLRAGAGDTHGTRLGFLAIPPVAVGGLLALAGILLALAAWGGWIAVRARDRVGEALVVLVVALLALRSAVGLEAIHYAYPLAIPAALLAADAVARRPVVLRAALALSLAISLVGVAWMFTMTSVGEAEEYVLARAEPGDAILTTDWPIFERSWQEGPTLRPTPEALATQPQWLVLAAAAVPTLADEPAFARYELVHVAEPALWEGEFRVYELRGE